MNCTVRVNRHWGATIYDDPCKNKAKFKIEYKMSKSGNTVIKSVCTSHKKAIERAVNCDLGVSEIISISEIE